MQSKMLGGECSNISSINDCPNMSFVAIEGHPKCLRKEQFYCIARWIPEGNRGCE